MNENRSSGRESVLAESNSSYQVVELKIKAKSSGPRTELYDQTRAAVQLHKELHERKETAYFVGLVFALEWYILVYVLILHMCL